MKTYSYITTSKYLHNEFRGFINIKPKECSPFVCVVIAVVRMCRVLAHALIMVSLMEFYAAMSLFCHKPYDNSQLTFTLLKVIW